MRAIPYMHPTAYNFYLRVLHRSSLRERYKIISGEIGCNNIVFELGCGTGILAEYLDKSCDYIGWDLNQAFIRYLKKKGRKVELRDIFDFSGYPRNHVCVITDVLHHVVPKEWPLVRNALKSTEKLIVVEPYKAFNFPLPNFLRKYYDSVLGDNDGINPYRNRVNWDYSPEGLKKYFMSFGAHKVTEVGKDVIAIFYSGKDNVSEIDNQ